MSSKGLLFTYLLAYTKMFSAKTETLSATTKKFVANFSEF
jgi:hypothetical protein